MYTVADDEGIAKSGSENITKMLRCSLVVEACSQDFTVVGLNRTDISWRNSLAKGSQAHLQMYQS